MKWLGSIKTQVTLLLLATILFSLFISGYFFLARFTEIEERSARERLRNAYSQSQHLFSEMNQRIVEVAQHLSRDQDLLANLGLIIRYEEPGSYQPLTFDPPKAELAALLERFARGADLDIAVIQKADGDPIAFFVPDDTGGHLAGYFRHDREGARQIAYLDPLSEPSSTPLSLQDPHLGGLEQERGSTLFHATPNGSIFLDYDVAIQDPTTLSWFGSDPHLRLGYLVDQRVINHIALRGGTGVHLQFEGSVLSAGGTPPLAQKQAELAMGAADANGSELGSLHWKRFSQGGIDYLGGFTRMQITGAEGAVLSFVQDSPTLSNSAAAMRETLYRALPLVACLLIPASLLFAHRVISRPLERLTQFSHHMTDGDYRPIEGIKGDGEFATLAKTFNAMSTTLSLREQQLRESRARVKGIIDHAPAMIYMKDLEGRYLLVNREYIDFLDRPEGEIIGATDHALYPDLVAEAIRNNDQRVVKRGKAVEFEEQAERPDGSLLTCHSARFPLRNDEGEIIALCGITTDISERKRTEQSLKLARRIIERANEAIIITDLQARIVDVNPAFERITGYRKEEVLGKNPNITRSRQHDKRFYTAMWRDILKEQEWKGEIWDRRKNGEEYPKWLSITTIADDTGSPSNYVGIFSDISRQKSTEAKLEQLAYYDPLTGMPNRRYFVERLRQDIQIAARAEKQLALLFLDLDRFKDVNDTLGHDAGDELLKRVADRLTNTVRKSDIVARLGGDEFTILLGTYQGTSSAEQVAQKVVDEIARPFDIFGKQVYVGTSIGISIYPDDGESLDQVIKHADLAMYQAKKNGRNGYSFYSANLQTQLDSHILMVDEMRQAIGKGEFRLVYLPIVDLSTDQLVGVEGLLRWSPAEGEARTPHEFIPVAEESGLIIPLGRWAIQEACRQTALWNRLYDLSLQLSINLSARQLRDDALIPTIESACTDSGLPPASLQLELSESVVAESSEEAISTMQQLRKLGVSIAIDDFGTGHSSLESLKSLPVSALKIDRPFTQGLGEAGEDDSITRAILSMAKSLELEVVAEGVETEQQLAFLKENGCHYAQGFLLHKPLDPEAFGHLFEGEMKPKGSTPHH